MPNGRKYLKESKEVSREDKKKKKKLKECKKTHIQSMSQEELQHQLEQIIEPIEKLRGESVIKKIIFKIKLIAHRKNI